MESMQPACILAPNDHKNNAVEGFRMNQLSKAAQPAPTVDLSGVLPGAGVQSSSTLQQAAALFLENGCVVLKNAFDVEVVRQLQVEFTAGYRQYFEDRQFPDALRVGDRRTMVTVRVEGSFNSPAVYANSRTFGLLKYLLSDAMILGSMGAVAALPGAQWQHQHRDHANIFDTTMVYPGGDRCYPVLPPYAITLVLPLVPLDEMTGSTRLWPGSHLVLDSHALDGAPADPTVGLGDCYLMDYRLMHGGMPNRSDIVRPILYNVYYRPWFRDYQNYPLQSPLAMTETERRKVPQAYRGLFDWSFARSNFAGAAPAAPETLVGQRFYPQPSFTVRI
jgi:hypothetical protein